MNLKYDELEKDEIEISIKRVLEQCINKIHVIAITVVIFAILIPLIVYNDDKSVYENIVDDNVSVELSVDEEREVDLYFILKAKVEELEDYVNKTPILQMDHRYVYTAAIRFYVEGDESVQSDIAYAIVKYMTSKGCEEKFVANISSQDKNVTELIRASLDFEDCSIFDVYIYGENEEQCEEYIKALKYVINDYSDELNSKIGNHELVVLIEEVSQSAVSEIYSMQNNIHTEIYNATKTLNDYTATLSERQRLAIAQREGVEIQTDEMKVVAPKVNFVYVLLGAIVGAVVGVGVVLFFTVFSGTIQTDKEVYLRTRLTHLNTISLKGRTKKGKLINRLLYNRYDGEISVQVEQLSEKLRVYLKNAKIEHIAILGIENSVIEEISILKTLLENKNVMCDLVKLEDMESNGFDIVSNAEGVVLIEVIGKTKVDDIYRQIMECKKANTNIFGYIAIHA